MIIPLHLIPAQSPGALEFVDMAAVSAQGGVEVSVPDLGFSIVGPVDMDQLQVFHGLMQQAGLRLQPTRMLYDRLYAFECLAEAHASGSQALREQAMRLFDSYQRAGEWIGLLH